MRIHTSIYVDICKYVHTHMHILVYILAYMHTENTLTDIYIYVYTHI